MNQIWLGMILDKIISILQGESSVTWGEGHTHTIHSPENPCSMKVLGRNKKQPPHPQQLTETSISDGE